MTVIHTQEAAVDFARDWVAAWNARDLDAVLDHYAEHVVFRSPFAEVFVPGSGGVISGKGALRQYWTVALEATPGLHFTLETAYAGTGTIAIAYTNERGGRVCEVVELDGGLVVRGTACYAG